MANHGGMSLRLDTADDYALIGYSSQQSIDNEDSFSCPSSTASTFSHLSSPGYYGPNTPASARTASGCSSPRERPDTNFNIPYSATMHIEVSGMATVTSSPADYYPEALHSSFCSSPVFFRDAPSVKGNTSGGSMINAPLAPSMAGGYGQWNQGSYQFNNNVDPYATMGEVSLTRSHTAPSFVGSAASSPRMHPSSVWSHDNAPINFGFNTNTSPIKQEPMERYQRTLPIRRRTQLSAVQERTNALRNVQRSHRASRTSSFKKENTPSDTLVSVNGVNIHASKIPESKSRCDWHDCNKVFRRSEHLKRHMKSVHEKEPALTRHCPFCPMLGAQPKSFHGRLDNFRTHIEKHTNRNANGRVKYHPDAQAYLDELLKEVKPRKAAGTGGRSQKFKAEKQEDMDDEDF